MQVKEKEEKETKEEAEDDDAPKPSRWTRCMGCFNQCLEYVSYASGGDATLEAFKEMASNADTAAVNRAIATIQSHKSGIAKAQISIFNQQNAKNLDHGQAAAEAFLQRGWLCRIATLWPASHPWMKATHFSMLAPVRVNVALLFLKITSAGALSAVFFSSGSPSPGAISGQTFQGDMDDSVLVKLDSAGSEQWVLQTTLGTSGRDYIQGLTTDSSETWINHDQLYFLNLFWSRSLAG
eukprot:s5793_g1.t1